MKNAPHPGEILLEYMDVLDLEVEDVSEALGVVNYTVKMLVECRSSVNTWIAMRLAKCFSTTIDFWLNLQKEYDLSHYDKSRVRVKVLWNPKEVE